jgi:predicted dehydrogenase
LSWIDRAGNRHIAEHLVEAGSSDRNFIEAILGRAECECPFESALRVVELTEAAVKSSERGGAAVEVE